MPDTQEVHLILCSTEPGRAYPAFMLALGAATMGVNVSVYACMNGLDLVRKGAADKITMPGAPSLGKYLRDCMDAGVKVMACAPSREMLKQMGITEETVEKGVGLEDVVIFLDRALPAAKNGGIVLFV